MRSASGKSRRSLITAVGTIARLCRQGLRTVFADNVVAAENPARCAGDRCTSQKLSLVHSESSVLARYLVPSATIHRSEFIANRLAERTASRSWSLEPPQIMRLVWRDKKSRKGKHIAIQGGTL